MNTKLGKRFVIRMVLAGGLSLGATSSLMAQEDTLEPPIVPPTLLTETNVETALPELPASGEFTIDDQIVSDAITDLISDGSQIDYTDDAETESIRERYTDGAIKVERTVTLDSKGNYVNHGEFKMFSQEGKLIADGRYIMGERDGQWRRIYTMGEAKIFSAYPYSDFQAPFVSRADFQTGSLNGAWTITDAHGKIVSEIPFRDGLRHGKAAWNHPNGSLMYEANYNDGILQGQMAEYDQNGTELSSHTFDNGRRKEREVENHPNKQIKSEFVYLSAQQELKERDDWWEAKPAVYETAGKRVKNGNFTEWFSNGQKKATGQYSDGQLAGEFSSWYENGQRETRGEYTAGTPTSQWTWWHENGMRRAQGTYANGTPDGEWTSWTPEGKLAKRQTYSDALRGRSGTVVRSTNPNVQQQRRSSNGQPYRRPLR